MGLSVEALTAVLPVVPAVHDEPAPTIQDIQAVMAGMLADVLHVERVPVDGHFFQDLGADSMVMAQFCARVRKRDDLPPVSMKDVYQHPTISSLATALAPSTSGPVESPVATPTPAPIEPAPAPNEGVTRAGTWQYVVCGALQLLSFVGYTFLAALVADRGFTWVAASSSPLHIYLRAVVFGAVAFLVLCTIPIVAKWVLIGRWKPRQIQIWSLDYVRFWLVKTLVRSNPLLMLVGGRSHTSSSSPLYELYLRALGAKVGRGVAIFSRNLPVCTDLLTIGDGTVIRKDSFFNCYRAHDGLIQTGPVTLGKDVFIGEATVIDIGTSMGDGAQLGHASALHCGQVVPAGERWHGSPAQRTEVDYRGVGPADCGSVRRAVYAVLQLANVLFLYLPLLIGGAGIVLSAVPVIPELNGFLSAGPVELETWTFYRNALGISAALFFGVVLVGLLFVVTVPRLLNLAVKPDKTYRLYGFHYSLHRAIARFTNFRFYLAVFGNSSYIVHYLRWLGYDLPEVQQTGCNFGMDVKHESPYLVSIGRGTMVADGLSIINTDFSSTSFRASQASIGPRNFLGNRIPYPSQSRTGDNCLLATKVLVPIDGEVRQGVGLLGSPSFEIPRSVERDSKFDHLKSGDELRRRLSAKNRYNIRSMAWLLLVRWIYFFGLTLLAIAASDFWQRFRAEAIAAELLLVFLFTLAYSMLLERAVAGFRPLQPQLCSMYHPYFWWHERYWKFVSPVMAMFNGTPFKNVGSRLLGVRVGKRVFDDGCNIPEKTLVAIGDECTLNQETVIQCHSQEDGTFKSDRSTIGARCTLGVGGFVHYGVTMSDGAVLGPGSFLMKGEEVPPQARWSGNPATEIPADRPTVPVRSVSNGNSVATLAARFVPPPHSGGRHRADERAPAAVSAMAFVDAISFVDGALR
ncbi:MAG: nrps4 [Blastococcus sp.]|nr:nrps4 [Blastococcus sp.]